MVDEFDDFVVEMEKGNEDEHDCHVDEKGEDAAQDEFEEFGEDVGVFDLEDETAVGKVGEEDGNDPGDDVGDLELEDVFGVENREGEGVISAEADESGEDADDEIADDFGVFRVFGFEEMAEFREGHWGSSLGLDWDLAERLVSRVM